MGICCSRPHTPEDGRRSSESHGRLGRALLTRRHLVRVGIDDSNLGLEQQPREEYQRAAVQSEPMVSDEGTISRKSTVNVGKVEQNKESVNEVNTPCQQELAEPQKDVVHIRLCSTVSSLIAMFEGDNEDEFDDSPHHNETEIEAADYQFPPKENLDKETAHMEYPIPLCATVSSLIAIFEDANSDDDNYRTKKPTDGQSTTCREQDKLETSTTEIHNMTEKHETDTRECLQRKGDHPPSMVAPCPMKLEPLPSQQKTCSYELHKVHKEMEALLEKSVAIADNEYKMGGGLTPVCIDDISRTAPHKFTEFTKAPLKYTVKDLRDDCIAQPTNIVEIPQNTDNNVASTDTESEKSFASGTIELPDNSTKIKEINYVTDKPLTDYRIESVEETTSRQYSTKNFSDYKITNSDTLDKLAITKQAKDDEKSVYDKYIKSVRIDKNGVENAKNAIKVFEKDNSSGTINKRPIITTTHKISPNVLKMDKDKYSICQRQTKHAYISLLSCSKTNYENVDTELESMDTSTLEPRNSENTSHLDKQDNVEKCEVRVLPDAFSSKNNEMTTLHKLREKADSSLKMPCKIPDMQALKPRMKSVCMNNIDNTRIIDGPCMDTRVAKEGNTSINENSTMTKSKPIEKDTIGSIDNNLITKYGKFPDMKKDTYTVSKDNVETYCKESARNTIPAEKIKNSRSNKNIETSDILNKQGQYQERANKRDNNVMVAPNILSTSLTISTTEQDTAMFVATRMQTADKANTINTVIASRSKTSAAVDKSKVEILKDAKDLKQRCNRVTPELASAKRTVTSEVSPITASALAQIPTIPIEKQISLTVAKSLEKINTHNEKGHCEIPHYVRSPDGREPRLITLSTSPKMIREGVAMRKIIESKSITKLIKPPGPLRLERKKSKIHIGKDSNLVTSRGRDGPKMVQKEGPSGSSMLSSVPQFYEPQGIRQNARQRMGLQKLQKYKITIQCQAIERIKVYESEFPGILPEKLRKKWRAKINEQKTRLIN